MYFDGVFPSVGRRNTEQSLHDAGLLCPPTDADLLDRYITSFQTFDHLPRMKTVGQSRNSFQR
ncbi:hypothetical protein [Streptomyces sp. NPDC048191]|uniref:hypothetical protein n=1 Tax=Streptomyces sp. NPDC048191 TaxID=3155484 RepID=UPI0033DB73A8